MKKVFFLTITVIVTLLFSACAGKAGEIRSYFKEKQSPVETVRDVLDPEPNDSVASDSSDESESESAFDTASDPVEDSTGSGSETEALSDPSLTVAGLKALNYSLLKARAVYLVDQFLNSTTPKNEYSNLFFHHNGSFLSYDDPEYEYLLGIDVSTFQGEIDWAAVKAQGISFAIIRAGYRGYGENGSLNEDDLFRQNMEGAKEAGLLVGAYFFSQAVTVEEAREEAGYMLSLLDGITLDLPIVFDEEIIRDDDARTDQMLLTQFNENAHAFFEEILAAGYTPMLYTNLLFECLIYNLEQFPGVPVWFAGYEPLPLTPYHFDIWQYSESGTIDGIEGPVDLNIWISMPDRPS